MPLLGKEGTLMLNDWLREVLKLWQPHSRVNRSRRAAGLANPAYFGLLEQLEERRLLSTSGAAVAFVVAPTNTIVASSADPAVVGQPVTFTVAVAPTSSSANVPTGTVAISIDGTAQPNVTLVNGLATLT